MTIETETNYAVRGYFVSDDAESAAKWKAVERLRAAKEHLLALETEMAKLGKEWLAFGEALKRPGNFVFAITNDVITLGQHDAGLGRPLGRLTPADVNWERFFLLLTDYQKTSQEKAELTAKLRDAGLPIA